MCFIVWWSINIKGINKVFDSLTSDRISNLSTFENKQHIPLDINSLYQLQVIHFIFVQHV